MIAVWIALVALSWVPFALLIRGLGLMLGGEFGVAALVVVIVLGALSVVVARYSMRGAVHVGHAPPARPRLLRRLLSARQRKVGTHT